MFLNTLDLTLGKVRVVVEKKRLEGSGICQKDGRGKHLNQKRIPLDAVKFIEYHIKMFPAYKSHYSRIHSEKQYLSPDLSISKMYRLYNTLCLEQGVCPQKESFYRKIFVEHFNLAFHRPRNDTCGKCDKFKIKQIMTVDKTEMENLKQEKKHHLDLAEESYAEKRKDKTNSITNPNIAFLSFDCQLQCCKVELHFIKYLFGH